MTLSGLKKHYSQFLRNHEGKLHFAAHSHHFWPDVSRSAHVKYWDDSSELSDEKWGTIFAETIPRAQRHVARILNLKDTRQISFAPNTHELGARILSLFAGKSSLNVLTTTSEFHSWRRQIQRLRELPRVAVEFIDTKSFFTEREIVLRKLFEGLKKKPDLFFISQVFFDSGLALTEEELLKLAEIKAPETVMVVDGYHGFAALPTDLSSLEGKIFYLGGGYKYAQAGEGAAFLVVPKGHWRPAYTGWFAEYGDLTGTGGDRVGYSEDGMAFFGATFDPSGLYRFNAVWDFFEAQGLTVEGIHGYVRDLSLQFLRELGDEFFLSLGLTPLFSKDLSWHGHFLTFEAASEPEAQTLVKRLKDQQILIDLRGKRLRIGFGSYQDEGDVRALTIRLRELAASLDKK